MCVTVNRLTNTHTSSLWLLLLSLLFLERAFLRKYMRIHMHTRRCLYFLICCLSHFKYETSSRLFFCFIQLLSNRAFTYFTIRTLIFLNEWNLIFTSVQPIPFAIGEFQHFHFLWNETFKTNDKIPSDIIYRWLFNCSLQSSL